jgi:hypothetical protein
MPDVPRWENPGLVDAHGVIWKDGAYVVRGYFRSTYFGTPAPFLPIGSIWTVVGTTNYFYVGTQTKIYEKSTNITPWNDRSGAAYTTPVTGYWRWTVFDDLVIGTNYTDFPQASIIGSGSAFSALATVGTAPKARVIGVVGRHVVLGDLAVNGKNVIQWGRIDVATEWPTPGTADALAKQAGEQYLRSEFGAVTGIFGNDQYGIIIQERGITRMTYVGGDLVYQFDEYEFARGCLLPNAMVKEKDYVYFVSPSGFCRTNGIVVEDLGDGTFSSTMSSDFYSQTFLAYRHKFYAALDLQNSIIYFSVPDGTASGNQNKLYLYNTKDARMTTSSESVSSLVQTQASDSNVIAFGEDSILYKDVSDARELTYAAYMTTGYAELVKGGRVFCGGVTPISDVSSMQIAIAGANERSVLPVFSSYIAKNSRTGVCDCRIDARLMAVKINARVGSVGQKITGIQYQYTSTGVA